MSNGWQFIIAPAKLDSMSRLARACTTDRLLLAGLLVFTLLVRSGVLWAMRDNLQQDPDAYREIAENLLRFGEFASGKRDIGEVTSWPTPTAYRPPLYPVVLSNLPTASGLQVSLLKVAVLHVLLGVATVWLTWLTAAKLLSCRVHERSEMHLRPDERTVHCAALMHPTAPLLAGFLVACDPLLLNQQTLVMTETLAAFLAILALWCLVKFDENRSWFAAGLAGGVIGLAVLCRPTFLPWLGLVAIGMLIVRGRNSEFRIQNSEFYKRRWFTGLNWRLANVAGLVIGAAAVLSPWAIRNYRVFGKPIVTTTHGGYTLYLANNPNFYEYLRGESNSEPWVPGETFGWRTVPFPLGIPNWTPEQLELLTDDEYYSMARSAIRKERASFFYSCLYRLRQLWSPLPHKLTADESLSRRLLRYATCGWYCGVYALAAIGIWRLRRKLLAPPWIWGVLLCFAFTAVHTFYFTNLRMRAPLIPFIAIVAGAAIAKFEIRNPKHETNSNDQNR
jgi:Dolichyl-phosphate-mannose-protein mannosyltransferase